MLIGTSFANPRVAQAFVDYLPTQGVIPVSSPPLRPHETEAD
ncbi:hypothetical protein Q2434_24470, partial [Escherichia coli]|nr:hypothetical protein [Escherichia coli]